MERGCGRVGAQQVGEEGRYISASAGGIIVVNSVVSPFLEKETSTE